jgi:putative salt-induced outer membrane protein
MTGKAAQLSLQAGPAWRRVDFLDGTSDSSLGALAGLDFDWQIAKALKFTQDANLVADGGGAATVLVDSNNTSVLLTSGLEAKISDRLTTRLSYTFDYDSNPPIGAVSTDTLTRFTLVYGF